MIFNKNETQIFIYTLSEKPGEKEEEKEEDKYFIE